MDVVYCAWTTFPCHRAPPPPDRKTTHRPPDVVPRHRTLDGVVEAVSQVAGIGSIDRDAFTTLSMSQTLLLADDSATVQRVIELTFADEDIRVIAVGDGQQAIDRITASPPDIVLADVSMPERDGYDVATFIKEDPALAHIPVVLLRVAGEPVDEDRARQAGCDAVLVKPLAPRAVVGLVRELLGGRTSQTHGARYGRHERRAARLVWGGPVLVAATLLLLGWWLSSRTRR